MGNSRKEKKKGGKGEKKGLINIKRVINIHMGNSSWIPETALVGVGRCVFVYVVFVFVPSVVT